MNTTTSASHIWWQPALGHEGRVTGADDIAQAIRIILSTPKGADPLRPEFGSNLSLYLDWPVNRARPYVIREAVDAIRQWEKRCEVVRVEPVVNAERLTLRVRWRVAGDADTVTEVVWR
ncbi:TPA: GPW/gp25 family protein [Salmonella enterica subsp. enterica serovar Potsdam]